MKYICYIPKVRFIDYTCNRIACPLAITTDQNGDVSRLHVTICLCETIRQPEEGNIWDNWSLDVDGDTTTWTFTGVSGTDGDKCLTLEVSGGPLSYGQSITAVYDHSGISPWVSMSGDLSISVSNSIPAPVLLFQMPQFNATSGELELNGWYTNRAGTITPLNEAGNPETVPAKQPGYRGARNVRNIVTLYGDHPITQSHTVVSGRDYVVRIGATSAAGSSAACTGAITSTLTADGINPIGIAAQTASSTSINITITGDVRDLQIEDVTDKTIKLPGEYASVGGIAGTDLVDEQGAAYWGVYGSNTIVDEGDAVKLTYVNHSQGAYIFLRAIDMLSEDMVVGETYALVFDAKVNTGGSVTMEVHGATWRGQRIVNFDSYREVSIVFVCDSVNTHLRMGGMGAGEIIWMKNFRFGLASRGYKVFNRQNGNTVGVGGVIIETPGAKILPTPVWHHTADATDMLLHDYLSSLINVNEGAIYMDVELEIDTDNQNVLADFAYAALDDAYGTGDLLLGNAAADGSLVRAHDGTNALSLSYTNVTAGNTISFGLEWHTGANYYRIGQRVGGSWNWSSASAFVGFTPTDLIALMPAGALEAYVKEFDIWDS